MKIISIAKQYKPIKTAYKAYRHLDGLADVVYISEGTPNKRFERLSNTGWEVVSASTHGDKDYVKAKEELLNNNKNAVFIRTSSRAGKRIIYTAGERRRNFDGETITVNPRKI